MGVRVRVKIRLRDTTITTVALANTGFETESPQLLVPRRLLIANSIDQRSLGKPEEIEYDTAGGPVVLHVYPYACSIAVIESDKASSEVTADLVVSPLEKEVVMSDALIESLGIVVLSPRRGLWRFINDSEGMVRSSYSPEYW